MTHRLAQSLVLLTFVLLLAGGLVTSTDSGLAVPDWPLSFGTLFPPMIGGIRFEHTHRLIAASVGLLTFILMIAIAIGKEKARPRLRWLAIAAFAAVVLQGVLGGLTVLFRLPAPVSVAHACLGPIFFCWVVSLAELTNPKAEFVIASEAKHFSRLSFLITLFLFFQLFLGAVIRHTRQGIGWHLVFAFLIFVLVGGLVSRALNDFADEKWILRPALFLAFLVLVQFFLGIGAFVFTRLEGTESSLGQILFPTLHQTLGALLLATGTVLTLRSRRGRSVAQRPRLLSFIETTKPRLVLLVLWSVTVGFLMGSRGPVDFFLLAKTLMGVLLVAGGAMSLNELLERESDAKMKRTEERPLPSQRLSPREVLGFGVLISTIGLLGLAWWVNFRVTFLAGLTLASYLFIYTPLKRKTWACTLAGAIPGAFPPLLGWAAARDLDLNAWILFSILFVWQLPHFLVIAWRCREDYARAGFQILSVVDPTGERVRREILIFSLVLFLASLLPSLVGMTGLVYYLGAFLLGIWLLVLSFRTAYELDRRSLSFFKSSILYLGLLLFLMVLDKSPL